MQAEAKAIFMSLDSNRDGKLEPVELLKFFRMAMPSLQVQQLRYLVAHIRE